MITQTTCDPFTPEVVNNGEVSRDSLVTRFRDFPWQAKLEEVKNAKEEDVYFSPSIGFRDEDERKEISMTIVEDETKGYVFYLFFAKDKEVKKLFGLRSETQKEVTDLLDRDIDDCLEIIEMFKDKRFDELEAYFKR